MACISPTLGSRESKKNDQKGNEIRYAGDERKDKLYEPKHKQKLVRVLTVVAYVIFVSMAAILLSLYYTFLWDPKDVSMKMRIKPDCAKVKLPDSRTTPPITNEMQVERMTTKLMTMDEEDPRKLIPTTTQRPKDLLRILTEIASTKTSTTPPLSVAPEDLRTESSTSTESHPETTT